MRSILRLLAPLPPPSQAGIYDSDGTDTCTTANDPHIITFDKRLSSTADGCIEYES